MKIIRPAIARTRPLVSVVIPCYNYGHFLPEAVAGVLSQPGVDVEVIIVDDASSDGSVKVARELEDGDPRIQVVAHEKNLGHIATYNDGLRRVTGDYVVLLSADDLLAPGSLARSAALLEAHPEVGLVYGYAPSFEKTAPPAHTRVRSWTLWEGEDWIRRICARGTNLIVNPEAMVRRGIMDQLIGYDPAHPHAADMLLWMQAAALGGVGRVNGPDQAFYREHGNNMHMTDFKGVLADFKGRSKAFDAFFASHGAALKNEAALRAKANAALAREAERTATVAFHSGGDYGGAGVQELSVLATGLRDAAGRAGWGRRLPKHRDKTGQVPRPLMQRAYLAKNKVGWALRWRVWRRYGI